MRLLATGLGLWCLVSVGCTSIKTTVLDRREGGHLTKNPDLPLKGVPVMLRVPTHVDVTIEQVDYWTADDNGDLKLISENVPSRHVSAEIKHTEKMFLVDPKRVASGSGIYGFTFDAEGDGAGHGYLQGASYEAVDTTLQESAALISTIASVAGRTTSRSELKMAEESQVITTTRTIAYRKFDINACSIEDDIRGFVNLYLNDCHAGCCQSNVRYSDGVDCGPSSKSSFYIEGAK